MAGKCTMNKRRLTKPLKKTIDINELQKMFVSNEHLTNWIIELLNSANAQTSRNKEHFKVIKDLNAMISSFYSQPFVIASFGSRITGLAMKSTSDLDLMIQTFNEKSSAFTNWILKNVAVYMKSQSKNWVQVISILNCRTPIVKCFDLDTKLQCDIAASSHYGLINTQLIILMLNNIYLLKEMNLILRELSLKFNLRNYVNNYGLFLIILFFMQYKCYAPPVDDFKYDCPGTVIDGYECLDYTKVNYNWRKLRSTADTNLKNLLIDFFTYYSEFNFTEYVICPLVGKSLKKKLFNKSGKNLPPEMYSYIVKVRNGGEEFKAQETGMCLQDPIDLSHNITKKTGRMFIQYFVEFCLKAKHVLEMLK